MTKSKPQKKQPYKYVPCHTDGTLIFQSGGTSFYAGKYTHVTQARYDLIIDLANAVTSKVEGTNLRGQIKKFIEPKQAQILHLGWPDYGTLKWERGDFESLLAAIEGDQLESVFVCCMGGHGRTGTMMAILAGISGAVPDGACPVEWLRKLYCEKVVESDEQLDYVERITGLRVKAALSKPLVVGQGNLYKGSYQGGWQRGVYGGGQSYYQDDWYPSAGESKSYDGEYRRP